MEKIKKIIKEVFQAMGFDIISLEIKKETLKDRELLTADVKIDSKEVKYFIKEDTISLDALQHLLRILISKQGLTQALFILDINGYRKGREEFLSQLAIKAAQKVRRTKKPVALEPMSAYERRLIHLKLAEEPDIVTESTGLEPERRILIRLYP